MDEIEYEHELLRVQRSHAATAEKLAVLQALSRTVTHDFANLITAVEMVAARLHQRAGEEQELGRDLETVAHVAEGLLDLFRQFGIRAYPPSEQRSLREVIERITPVLVTITRGIADVTVDVQVGSDDMVPMTVDQLELVILSLVLNARDAIDLCGRIVLRARPDGDALLIEISDDGVGMSPDVLAHIWEPYFTTKENGTGLGLTSVHAAVVGAGGRISVDSAVGRGSTFRIRLPRAQLRAVAE